MLHLHHVKKQGFLTPTQPPMDPALVTWILLTEEFALTRDGLLLPPPTVFLPDKAANYETRGGGGGGGGLRERERGGRGSGSSRGALRTAPWGAKWSAAGTGLEADDRILVRGNAVEGFTSEHLEKPVVMLYLERLKQCTDVRMHACVLLCCCCSAGVLLVCLSCVFLLGSYFIVLLPVYLRIALASHITSRSTPQC